MKRMLAGLLGALPLVGLSGSVSFAQTAEVEPKAAARSHDFINSVGMKLVLLPARSFLMGARNDDKEADEQEKPQHQVRISRPFYLATTEVTQEQYQEIAGQNPSANGGPDHLPVDSVSWHDAVAFCNKLSAREGRKNCYQASGEPDLSSDGYRLPTEAEWEYACRAGTSSRYSFGNDQAVLRDFAWFQGNSAGKTHPVGQKRANAFGLFDMHGNVAEWCSDSSLEYHQSPLSDPAGPSQGPDRVVRGGSWDDGPWMARSSSRNRRVADGLDGYVGFRVARVAADH